MPDPLSGRTLTIATGHGLSLSLAVDGVVRGFVHEDVVAGHAERLVPALRALLGEGRPTACERVVMEVGPGSFTGLRVGAAAARALALAWRAPVIGVRSTLLVAAAARAGGATGPLAIALAAPRGQIWVERFGEGGLRSAGPPLALDPADAARMQAADAVSEWAGSGVVGHAARKPDARDIVRLSPDLFDLPELLYVRPAVQAAA